MASEYFHPLQQPQPPQPQLQSQPQPQHRQIHHLNRYDPVHAAAEQASDLSASPLPKLPAAIITSGPLPARPHHHQQQPTHLTPLFDNFSHKQQPPLPPPQTNQQLFHPHQQYIDATTTTTTTGLPQLQPQPAAPLLSPPPPPEEMPPKKGTRRRRTAKTAPEPDSSSPNRPSSTGSPPDANFDPARNPAGSSSSSTAPRHVNIKTKFPVARIKRIMQADEDVGKVAQVTPVVVSKALELFMIALCDKASEQARQRSSKRITASHLKQAIIHEEQFDFLADIIERIPDPPAPSEGGALSNGGDEDEAGAPPKKQRKTRQRKSKDETAAAAF